MDRKIDLFQEKKTAKINGHRQGPETVEILKRYARKTPHGTLERFLQYYEVLLAQSILEIEEVRKE